jgi:hypothetical protein
MSGNTTQLGLAVSGHEWNLVGIAATVLGLFFVGSFCGGLTAALQAGWRLPVVLGSEAVLLATAVGLALIFKREQEAGLLLPVAMGVQNAAIEELRRSAGGATGDTRMAVYADDAGEPGDLLGEAAGKSVTGTGHFEEFELLAPVAVSELDLVWICVLASPEIYSCDAGAPVESLARRILARTYEDGFPDPFGSASSYSANRSMRGKIWTNPP